MKRKILIVLISSLIVGALYFMFGNDNNTYGVFLNSTDLDKIAQYDEVVIDAQYFTTEEIDDLHDQGIIVYSYINVGAIEDFRDYYLNFEELFLSDYENWEEEKWIDVTDEDWQQFINDLSDQLMDKGVDGLFIDNLDVYYHYETEDVYNSIVTILKTMKQRNPYTLINGGDVFVTKWLDEGDGTKLFDAINQEFVFTAYDFDQDLFMSPNQDDEQYFKQYIQEVYNNDIDVYLLEYSDSLITSKYIQTYCELKGYQFYVSDDIELR